MPKTPVTFTEARAALAALGYTVKTRRNSEFIAGTVTHAATGVKVSGCNAMSAEFYNTYKPFFEYKEAHAITDNGWRVIL